MLQKFYASPRDSFTWPNGATGYRPGGPFDCLGPYAKVQKCPIDGTELRLTCYATGYADTFFSVPACTRYRGQYVGGFFTSGDEGVRFVPHQKHWDRVGLAQWHSSGSGRIETLILWADVSAVCHPGPNDSAVAELMRKDYLRAQLQKIDPETLRAELREFGAWDDAELADHSANLARWVWSACWDLHEEKQ